MSLNISYVDPSHMNSRATNEFIVLRVGIGASAMTAAGLRGLYTGFPGRTIFETTKGQVQGVFFFFANTAAAMTAF